MYNRNHRKSAEEQLVLDIFYSSSKRQVPSGVESSNITSQGQGDAQGTPQIPNTGMPWPGAPPVSTPYPMMMPPPMMGMDPNYVAWQQAQMQQQQFMWYQQQQYMMMQNGMTNPMFMPYMNPEFTAWQQAQYAQFMVQQQEVQSTANSAQEESSSSQEEAVNDNGSSEVAVEVPETKSSENSGGSRLMNLLGAAAQKRGTQQTASSTAVGGSGSSTSSGDRAESVRELKGLLIKNLDTSTNAGADEATTTRDDKKSRRSGKKPDVTSDAGAMSPSLSVDSTSASSAGGKKSYRDIMSGGAAQVTPNAVSPVARKAPVTSKPVPIAPVASMLVPAAPVVSTAAAVPNGSKPVDATRKALPEKRLKTPSKDVSKAASKSHQPAASSIPSVPNSDSKFAASKFQSSPDPDIIPMPNFEEAFFDTADDVPSSSVQVLVTNVAVSKKPQKSRPRKVSATNPVVANESLPQEVATSVSSAEVPKKTRSKAGAKSTASSSSSGPTSRVLADASEALKSMLKI